MFLITELSESVEFVSEARENSEQREHFITGRFIVGNEKNKNGRIYPMEVLEPEIERYIAEVVKPGRAFGELGHPSGPTINLERVSHVITELKRNGQAFDGRAKITNTPFGNTAKGLLESGGKLGVSTRGMGSLKEHEGAMQVQKDFKLATVDIVSDPSGPGCFVNGIMEGVEYFYDDIRGTWKEERVEQMRREAHGMSRDEREAKAYAMFEEYLAMLSLRETTI